MAFFGCLLAGVIAVPMMVPRRQSTRDSSANIVADCAPRFIMTSTPFLSGPRKDVAERFADGAFQWIAVDAATEPAQRSDALPSVDRETIAFLQYTSGSTSDPKGVVATHDNLLENLEMIRLAFGATKRSTFVSWIPLYHDMGLILTALQAFYVGSRCVLMAPAAFVQRPLVWLKAIQEYRGEIACLPNFAFDLCVNRFTAEASHDLDLSSWKVAVNASEPVHADTLERFVSVFAPYGFDAQSMCPMYGMAEATVLISGNERGAGHIVKNVSRTALGNHRVAPPHGDDDDQRVAGCGRALAGERIAIIDPAACRRLGTDRVGEIWVGGPHVAQGYWRNEAATISTFRAQIDGEPGLHWLRTGDLGFMDGSGELYITGRIKELIIIRGINHYPQDIERTAQSVHSALRQNGGAAFSVADDGEEQLVIAQEIERTSRHKIDRDEIVGLIRERVTAEHELFARHIVLLRPNSLPKTTSGKIQRSLTRRLWQERKLDDMTVEVV